jgi:hypothetical protein
MTDQRTIASTEDPVCGMTVDPAEAREKGLTFYPRRDRVRLLR